MTDSVVGLALAKSLPASPYDDSPLVRRLVHEALCAGLDTDATAPLAGFVRPGETVLLKPNWVLHVNRSGQGMECLVTQEAILDALLREVREAQPARVILGDAPVQGCSWDKLVTPELKRRLTDALDGIPLSFVDFRRQILRDEDLARGPERGGLADSRFSLFDLGRDSLLEPVSEPAGRFRVTMYDPERLAETHRPGRHQYLISREPFEADVVINVPKLKTHRKAGVTAALKNLVGINGNKDYLPHHRAGGIDRGGDCYPGSPRLKRAAEALLDRANRRIGTREHAVWRRLSSVALNAHVGLALAGAALRPDGPHTKSALQERRLMLADLEAGWYLNDTVWRTCLDLNRILLYGTADGSMTETRCARVLHVCDAIICGQAEGPLYSHPVPVGAVTCATSAAAADLVHAGLLGLDWRRLALVREAFSDYRWRLAEDPSAVCVRIGDETITPDEAADRYGVHAIVPRGWAHHCERTSTPGMHP